MATKRFTQSAINFKTVGDLVGEKHVKEVNALAVSILFPFSYKVISTVYYLL